MAALVRHEAMPADAGEIARLFDALDTISQTSHPRTARLLAAGRFKMAQKLIEEAAEVALQAARHRTRGLVRESADLVYQLVILWRDCGIAPEEVWGEMRRRADRFGLAEKLPKPCEQAPQPQAEQRP
jgi:phosphoribosyl-ATP pyrophosphohydrolase